MNSRNRVFLVVDDAAIGQRLRDILSHDGYVVRIGEDAGQAAQEAAQYVPDLIVVDSLLSGQNGYDVTRNVKQHAGLLDIPLLLITEQEGTDDKIKGLESGADEFLDRQLEMAEVQARVRSLIALKQYREQLHSRVLSEQRALAEQPNGAERKSLLLVEDDDVAARLIVNYLNDPAYVIKHCSDGASAVQWAERNRVDVILLDILLPGMDGFEVCRQVTSLEHIQNTQIVMITCLQDTESLIRGIELGVDDFLVKPINPEVLNARIRALVKKKEYLDRLALEYERALHSAITDPLTGLYNRGYLQQFLQLEINRAMRQHHPLSLIMFDIDNFKHYNDTFGHLAGDQILREIGRITQAATRKIDIAARYGGEEFVLVLPYTNAAGAGIVAERLRTAVERHVFAVDAHMPPQQVTISIGVSCFHQQAASPVEQLIHHADMALYQAKHSGKNQVRVADGE